MVFSSPRRLEPSDDILGFSCGEAKIDDWLHRRGLSSMKQKTAVVYAVFDDMNKLAAFYSLSAHSIDRALATGWLKRNSPSSIPVFLLGMLGVSKEYQGLGLGSQLLLDAYHRAASAADVIGARALVVDPLDEKAKTFYMNKGFEYIGTTERMFARF